MTDQQQPGCYPQTPGQQNLPKYTKPATLTIIGVVVLLIVTPILLIAVMGGKTVSMVERVTELGAYTQVQNGGPVEVPEDGAVAILISPASDEARCSLESGTGSAQLSSRSSFQGTLKANGTERNTTTTVLSKKGLEPGNYTLVCDGIASGALLSSIDPNIASDLTKAIASTVITGVGSGLIGLALLIAGIVWLIITWQKRKQMTPPPYNSAYGYPSNQGYGQYPMSGQQSSGGWPPMDEQPPTGGRFPYQNPEDPQASSR